MFGLQKSTRNARGFEKKKQEGNKKISLQMCGLGQLARNPDLRGSGKKAVRKKRNVFGMKRPSGNQQNPPSCKNFWKRREHQFGKTLQPCDGNYGVNFFLATP